MTTKRHLAKPDCALLAEESDSSCSEDGSHEVQGQGGITFRRRRIDPTELTPKQLDRVMKNRQAAQASRDRKRAYVTELEASRDRLEEEARELRVRVRDLEQEKDQLADEVCQLRGDFEELKKMMLCQLDPKEQAGLLDRLRAPRAGVVPCGGMVSSRMTDSLATVNSSPSSTGPARQPEVRPRRPTLQRSYSSDSSSGSWLFDGLEECPQSPFEEIQLVDYAADWCHLDPALDCGPDLFGVSLVA